MPNKPQPPTPREIAVIRYAIAFGITSKTDLYQIAYDGSLRAWANLYDAPAQANRWFKSKRITTLYERESALYAQRQAKERARIEAEAIARHEAAEPSTKASRPLTSAQIIKDVHKLFPDFNRTKLAEALGISRDWVAKCISGRQIIPRNGYLSPQKNGDFPAANPMNPDEESIRIIIREEVTRAVSDAFADEQKNNAAPELLTRDEVCRLLKISKPTFHALVNRGLINPVKIGSRTLVREDVLRQKIESGEIRRYKHDVKVVLSEEEREEGFLSTDDCCRLLNISKEKFYEMVNRGLIVAFKRGGQTMVRKSQILKQVESKEV